jgi:hypothetical protein
VILHQVKDQNHYFFNNKIQMLIVMHVASTKMQFIGPAVILGGVIVVMLAIGLRVRGFKPWLRAVDF